MSIVIDRFWVNMVWHISVTWVTTKAKITAFSSTLNGLDYLRTSVKQLVSLYFFHTSINPFYYNTTKDKSRNTLVALTKMN